MNDFFDLILKEATCLIHSSSGIKEEKLDLGIKNGKIKQIGSLFGKKAQKEINLKHLHVLPGAIDTQVHFRQPGGENKETIKSGSFCALKGGLTGYLEMPNTNPSTSIKERLDEKIQIAQKDSYCHFGFFFGATHENLEEIKKMHEYETCPGLKVFLGSSTGNLLVSDDRILENIMRECKTPIAFHSEDEKRLEERKHLRKNKDVKTHALWRDEKTAIISTKKVIDLAKKLNRRVHFLHITTKQEVDLLEKNKKYASFEITPNHLFFNSPDCYEKYGSLVQMNPPIREIDHQKRLMEAVCKEIVTVIGSDHAPHLLEDKKKDYPLSPSGIPGVQTIFPLMIDLVSQNKISLEALVRLMCFNPCQIYGIRNKGSIKENFDADFSVLDLKKTYNLDKNFLSYKCGYSPYEGRKLTGACSKVFLRGNLAMEDFEVLSEPQGEALSFKKQIAVQ